MGVLGQVVIVALILFSFQNCLRLYVGRDYESRYEISSSIEEVVEKKYTADELTIKEVFKNNQLLVYIKFERNNYTYIKGEYHLRYKKTVTGYNYNFSSETYRHGGCHPDIGIEGVLYEYMLRYPFWILLTFGVQIPFSILDYFTLPIRLYPYYEDETEKSEGAKLLMSKLLYGKVKVSYVNNLYGITQFNIQSKQRVTVSLNKFFTPMYYKKEISVKIDHQKHSIGIPNGVEEIVFVFE